MGILRPTMEEISRRMAVPHSICGENPLLPANRMGCGQGIGTCAEVYRCTDCTVPFHRDCARRHFGQDVTEGPDSGG